MIHPWLESHCQALAERIDAGRLGHAPLVQGPFGVGKMDLSLWLAARILCLTPTGPQPCGKCRSCSLIESGTHPDLFRIDVDEDRQSITVDQIRELIDKMQLTASVGRHRVGLVVTAEDMNRNAANALLKTLEEPASGAWLVLRSHRPARLPATIRSRCQQIMLRPPEAEVADEWLASRCPGNDPGDRRMALTLTGGAPLAALEMLQAGELDRGLEILQSLVGDSLRPASVLVNEWQNDATATWQWLARWVGVLMSNARGIESLDLALPHTLPGHLDPEGLISLWEQALDGNRLAERGSVRQDLLLGKWLLEWESLTEVRS